MASQGKIRLTSDSKLAQADVAQLANQLKIAFQDAQRLQAELTKLSKVPGRLNQQLRTLSQGTGLTPAILSTQRGIRADQRAQPNQVAAVGLREQVRLQDQLIQGARASLSLSERQQKVDLRRIGQMRDMRTIKAAELKASQAVIEAERKGSADLDSKRRTYQAVLQQKERIVQTERAHSLALAESQRRLKALSAENIRFGLDRQKASLRAGLGDRELQELRNRQAVESRRFLATGAGAASLLEVQTRILFNFVALNAAFRSFTFVTSFVVELDQAMRNLQAITATTETEMSGLRDRLIDVSENTKFTALEVTEAATTLGQAGFSTKQIESSIEAITLLATATGTDLAQSVDVVTSAITVFNLQASEAANVANLFTAAVNESKLNMDKLALGIQYASNVAAQSGASLTEVTTLLSAFANSGIRSGSTLGTGLRQLILELQAPTEKFKQALGTVGLSVHDVDIRSQGLIGALKNLNEAGFTAADGMKVFEVRSAAAFAAITRDVDSLTDLEQRILLTSAAVEANDIQMKGLVNTAKVFKSVIGTLAAELGGDVVRALQRLLAAVNETFKGLNGDGSSSLAFLGNLVTSGVFAALSLGALSLAKNLSFVANAAKSVSVMIGVLKSGVLTLRGAMFGLTVVAKTFLPFLAITGGLALLFTMFGRGADEAERLANELDQVRAALAQASGKVDESQTSVASLDDAIENLNNRAERLRNNGDELKTAILDLENRFRSLGLVVDDNNTTFDQLIERLQQIRKLSNVEIQIQLEGEREALAATHETLQNLLQTLTSRNLTGLIRDIGLEDRLIFPKSTVQTRAPSRQATGFDPSGLPAPIVDAINLLTSGRMPSLDEASLLQSQIQSLKDNSEVMEQFGQQVVSLLELLRPITANALEEAKTEGLIRQNQSESQVNAFERTPTAARLADDVLTANRVFDNVQRQIAEADTAGGREEALKQGRDALYAVLARVYGEIRRMAAEDPDSLGDFQKTRSFERLVGLETEIEGTALEVEESVRDATRLVLEGRKRVINNELSKLQKDANNRTSQSELKSVKDYANSLYSELAEVEKGILSRQNFDAFKNNIDLRKERFAEVDDQISEQRDSFNIKLNELIDESIRTKGEFDESILEGVKRSVEDAKKGFKRAADQANSPLQTQQARMDGLQSGVNVGQVPESILFFEGKKQSELETQALAATIPARENYIKTLTQQKSVLDELVRSTEMQVGLLQEERLHLDRVGAGAEVKKEKQDELQKAVDEHNKALNQQIDLDNELASQRQEQIQDIEKLTARTEEYSVSLREVLQASAARWIESEGLAEGVAVKIDRSFQKTFTSLRDGTKQWVVDFASGTEAAGNAFANFGRRVSETILDIAATEAANGLVGFALQAVTSFFSPASNTAGIGGNRPGGFLPGTQIVVGGPRAAGGPVTGGVPNRDSVLTPTMPGEFVVRKTAVDAVGSDFLHAVNAGRIPTINNIVTPGEQSGGPEYLNLIVVTPEQRPVPGPRDIIAVVTQDMVQGGQTGKVVKQIMLKDV